MPSVSPPSSPVVPPSSELAVVSSDAVLSSPPHAASTTPSSTAITRAVIRRILALPLSVDSPVNLPPADERGLDHRRRDVIASHVDGDLGPDVDVRGEERQGDAVAERRREVPAGDLARGLPVDEDDLLGTRRPTALDGQAAQAASHPPLPLRHQRLAAPEPAWLVPRHHPAQTGLERR